MSASEAVKQLYQDLIRCYEAFIKTKAVLKKSRFHLDYEFEIYRLAYDIYHRRYAPSKSNIFVVLYPKPREIIAAHLRDRIVHNYIYNYMSPFWERRFSGQSYACRQGKGPLRAVQDLKSFVRGHRAHSSQPLYYLKVDVAAFFPTIDIGILKSIIFKKLTHPLYRYLVTVILDHRPVDRGQFILKSPSTQWSKIPRHKSMFYAPRDKGLPIGNLTSQFFANIYLNELDQYIRHHLQGWSIYWQRYVDDVLFLATDVNALKLLPNKIDDFLATRLKLRLNSSKTIIQPLARGLDHLGFWLKPDHLLVRQKNVKTFYEKLNTGVALGPKKLQATMNSYIGMFCHADTRRLRANVGAELIQKNLFDGRLRMAADSERVIVGRDLQQEAATAAAERELYAQFQATGGGEHAARRYRRYAREWISLAPLLKDAAIFLDG